MVTLWTKRFTMIISAWWIRTSSKFSEQEFEEILRNIGLLETFKKVRGRDSSDHEVVIAIKSARNDQYLASDAVR